jgi:hypothetical protein
MLTQLSTVKTRLAINQFDLQYDATLTSAITGVSAHFASRQNTIPSPHNPQLLSRITFGITQKIK